MSKSFLDPIDHVPSGIDFVGAKRTRRFDIDDDARLYIDQIVG